MTPAGPMHSDVVRTLSHWQAPSVEGDALRHTFLAFLTARPDAVSRTCTPGHITASVVVLSADRSRVLLTLHPRVGAWLNLGGHLEASDGSLVDAAAREAREEGGFEVTVDPEPLDLHCHAIICKGYAEPTRHLDVRFVAVAPAGAQEVISDESDDLRWFDVTALPEVFPEVAALVAAAVARRTESP